MKKLNLLFISLITILNACSSSNNTLVTPPNNQVINTQNSNNSPKKAIPVFENTNNIVKAPVPMNAELAGKIAKLFDRDGNGMIDSSEFKANGSIWKQNKVIENYENWDHIKKIPLKPIPVEAVTRALSLNSGDGYFYFGSVPGDNDVNEDDYSRIAEGLANLLLNDSISENNRIPVGTYKIAWDNSTKILTENISENSLRKALIKQFQNSPETQIELSNRLHTNNDGNEKQPHRIGRIDHEYIGWW